MKKTNILLLAISLSAGASSVMGLSANINWGSAAALGAAQFQGSDGASADSITLGYFSVAANADLTGWNPLAVDNTFNNATGFNTAATGAGFDVTAANGADAWILINDGALFGLIRANDWVTFTGTDAPAPEPTLSFQFDTADTAAGVSTFSGAGSLLTVTDGGGFNGGGIGLQLTAVAVPEPSTYAALAGLLALGAVMVRRRRA